MFRSVARRVADDHGGPTGTPATQPPTTGLTNGGGAQADGTIQLVGQQLELRLVDDVFYLKADEAFWADNAGAEVAKLTVGKWFKGFGLREHGGEGSGTLYVAQSEKKAYPLLVEPVAKADSAQATFSDWNAKVTVTAPPDDQVVDLDELDG
jgi:hypothetical protein